MGVHIWYSSSFWFRHPPGSLNEPRVWLSIDLRITCTLPCTVPFLIMPGRRQLEAMGSAQPQKKQKTLGTTTKSKMSLAAT
eukprot:2817669-Alexandrium_andersonii.AAC.1